MELVEEDNREKNLAIAGKIWPSETELTLGTDSLAAIQVLALAFVMMFVIHIWKERPETSLLVFGAVSILAMLLLSLWSQHNISLEKKGKRIHNEKLLNSFSNVTARFQPRRPDAGER